MSIKMDAAMSRPSPSTETLWFSKLQISNSTPTKPMAYAIVVNDFVQVMVASSIMAAGLSSKMRGSNEIFRSQLPQD